MPDYKGLKSEAQPCIRVFGIFGSSAIKYLYEVRMNYALSVPNDILNSGKLVASFGMH